MGGMVAGVERKAATEFSFYLAIPTMFAASGYKLLHSWKELTPADLPLFSIGFVVSRSRDLLRRLLKEHVSEDAQQMLADRVLDHLELSGFEIDETDQVMRKRPPTRNHG